MNDFIKTLLKQNGWDCKTFFVMKAEYIKQIRKTYDKYSFVLSSEMLEDLALFYNMKLRYELLYNGWTSDMILNFNIKKSSKYTQESLDWQAKKLHVDCVIHIADINPGYQNIWLDEQGRVWGDFEQYICFYGSTIFEGIENIITNRGIKK